MIFGKNVFAALKLNEIYPAPSTGEDEWIELYNDEDEILDISNYQLLDLASNKIKISTESASPFGFVLAISSSVLNNSGDTVYLYKCPEKQLIDYKTYPNANPTISFGRFPDGNENWGTCFPTREALNSSCVITITPTLNPTITLPSFTCPTLTPTLSVTPPLTPTPIIMIKSIPTETPTPTFTPTPQSYDNIYLSEAMVYPQSGNNEWIEIFNNNDYSVSLNNWFIDDIENGGSSPKSFSTDISAKSYYVFNLSSSMFNNSGDSVRLLDNNKNLKDSFEYTGGDKEKTFGRTSLDSDDFCQQELSNGTVNNPCINPTPTIITSIKMGLINQTPTISPSNKPVSINQLINTKKSIVPTVAVESGEVLGTSNKLLTNSSNNKSLINTLLFISCSYSLLTMMSILIKMRFIYAKIVRLLPSFIYPS